MESDQSKIYKTWEDGYVVRRMTKTDLPTVLGWNLEVNPTSCDLELVYSLLPADIDGFYVGEYQGELVASAIRIPVAEGIYYGSFYYVVPKYRKRGFGKRLRDDVAQPSLHGNILCIDAIDYLLEMNKKRGYKQAFNLTHFEVEVDQIKQIESDHSDVKEANDIDFKLIMEYDNKCFVKPNSDIRKEFLKKWISISGGSSKVLQNSEGDVIGFGCRRPAIKGNYHLIGPLYAENYQTALKILLALCQDVQSGYKVSFDVCDDNTDAMKLAQDMNMQQVFKMIRMHLNGDPNEFNTKVYGVTSVEVCGF